MENYEKYARIIDDLYYTFAVLDRDSMNSFSHGFDEIGAAYGLAGLFDGLAAANKIIKQEPLDKESLTKVYYNIANGAILNIMQLKSFDRVEENTDKSKPKQIINEGIIAND